MRRNKYGNFLLKLDIDTTNPIESGSEFVINVDKDIADLLKNTNSENFKICFIKIPNGLTLNNEEDSVIYEFGEQTFLCEGYITQGVTHREFVISDNSEKLCDMLIEIYYNDEHSLRVIMSLETIN